MNKLEKLLLTVNFFIYSCFTIFSFSQVDLNLTINQNPLFLNFVTSIQQVGYYNRPASAAIFTMLEIITFSFFALNLYLFYKRTIKLQYFLISLFSSVILLTFAYPFLSADIFNYLFDAKIILKYASNPYTHKPLDFPQDEWLRFMRWTHRYSPYGPTWLSLSLIPSILGLGKFTLTVINFKIFIAVFHLVNSYLIYKIVSKLNYRMAVFGTSFYALNPLVLIEGIANGHNDIVQATFLLIPIYLLLKGNKLFSLVSITFGILIKYISVLQLPLIIFEMITKKTSLLRLVVFSIFILSFFTVIYSTLGLKVPFVSQGSTQIQFQPWYLIWTLPLIALTVKIDWIILATALCLGASLRYLPYLYYGDWSHPNTIAFMQFVTFVPLFLAALFLVAKKAVLKN